jgi:hypothetical protein
MKKLLLALLLVASSVYGQVFRPTGPFVFTGVLASIPATCSTGTLAFITNATAGQQIYECSATDTWTQQLNSGAGGGITIGTTAITGGTATRVLFEAAGPVISDDAGMTYNAATDTLTVGNLATAGTVDGRDVSVDGAKLDGLPASALQDVGCAGTTSATPRGRINFILGTGAPAVGCADNAGTNSKDVTITMQSGTVTSAGTSFTGGLISVAGSPVTTSGTAALTVAGTSGGIPYFSGATTWATSGALTVNSPVLGGGVGASPVVVAGLTTDGTSQYVAGVAGASVGSVKLNNATSGSVVIQPDTGALGTTVSKMVATGDTLTVSQAAFLALSGNYVLTDTTNAQKAFDASTNGQFNAAASTTYQFECLYLITNTGTTSHQWQSAIGGTATFTSLAYNVTATTAGTAGMANTQQGYATSASAFTITSASTSATENVRALLTGLLRVNGAGTIIPQVKLSATTGGTLTMLANSYCRLTPWGSNTVTTSGNWN